MSTDELSGSGVPDDALAILATARDHARGADAVGQQRHVPRPGRARRRPDRPGRSTSRCAASARCGTSSPGLHRREVAAFRLSETLGIGAVPPTVLRADAPLGEGSLQWFVDADHAEHYFTIAEQRPDLHDQLRGIAVLDVVANNTDRKSGHCLLARDPGGDAARDRVWAIDNGLCFATDFKLRTVIWEFAGEALTPRPARRGGARSPTACRTTIAELISPRRGRRDAAPGPLARRAQGPARRRQRPPLPVAAGVAPNGMNRSADPVLDELIHRADLDGLVRLVDDCTASGDWARLRRLRDRARHAVGTGRQLWPAATLAEYRLALLAPPEWAAGVLDEGSGRFTIGPLTEVDRPAPRVDRASPRSSIPGPGRRSSPTSGCSAARRSTPPSVAALPNALDLPYQLAPWEPAYALATYHDSGRRVPGAPDSAGVRRRSTSTPAVAASGRTTTRSIWQCDNWSSRGP